MATTDRNEHPAAPTRCPECWGENGEHLFNCSKFYAACICAPGREVPHRNCPVHGRSAAKLLSEELIEERREEQRRENESPAATTESRERLMIVPVTFGQACAFVADHHRHHRPPPGTKFAVGVAREGDSELVGVALVGRPVARAFDDGLTLEVNRTCTDGTPNANSALYGAAWRAASALGYRRLITYTQAGESGASLRGAGWKVVAEREARGSWAESSVKLRGLRDPVGSGGVQRTLWEAVA